MTMRTMVQVGVGSVMPYIDNMTNEQIEKLLDNIQTTIDDIRGNYDDTIKCGGTDTE